MMVIYMWDTQSSNFLVLKHDPFLTSKGEMGMTQSSDNDDTEYDDRSTFDPTSTSTLSLKKTEYNKE